MLKEGDYQWRQLSMWDFAPPNCIEKFEESENPMTGKKWHAHYYLRQCMSVDGNSSQWRTVGKDEAIPDDVKN